MSSPRNRFWMMSSPGSRFLDDVFSRKSFFWWLLLQRAVFGWCPVHEVVFWMMSSPGSHFFDDVFSRKSFFGWCLLQEAVFEWCLLQEVVFWMMSSPRSCFRKNVFWKIISLKCLENAWKNLRTVDPRIEAKNQGAKFQLKKAWPKSQARSFKKSIQISEQQPKNGAARFSLNCQEGFFPKGSVGISRKRIATVRPVCSFRELSPSNKANVCCSARIVFLKIVACSPQVCGGQGSMEIRSRY